MYPLCSCVHKSCIDTLPVVLEREPAEELLCWHVQSRGASRMNLQPGYLILKYLVQECMNVYVLRSDRNIIGL